MRGTTGVSAKNYDELTARSITPGCNAREPRYATTLDTTTTMPNSRLQSLPPAGVVNHLDMCQKRVEWGRDIIWWVSTPFPPCSSPGGPNHHKGLLEWKHRISMQDNRYVSYRPCMAICIHLTTSPAQRVGDAIRSIGRPDVQESAFGNKRAIPRPMLSYLSIHKPRQIDVYHIPRMLVSDLPTESVSAYIRFPTSSWHSKIIYVRACVPSGEAPVRVSSRSNAQRNHTEPTSFLLGDLAVLVGTHQYRLCGDPIWVSRALRMCLLLGYFNRLMCSVQS